MPTNTGQEIIEEDKTDGDWVPGTTPSSSQQYDQMVAYMEGQKRNRWQKFANCAVLITKRDGLPEKGSNEIRLHNSLGGSPYIATNKPMVSFRLLGGSPVALLEVLFADDENTHIVDRRAMVVNPETGKIYDPDYFGQVIPGDLPACLRYLELQEIALNRAVKKETSNPGKGRLSAHVKAWRQAQAMCQAEARDILLKAAGVMELEGVPESLAKIRGWTPAKYCAPKI